jgi:hypothetical protein
VEHDYYLWRALKGKVYENNPHTVDELKAAVTTHTQQIPPTTLLKVFDNMKKCVQACLQARGDISNICCRKNCNVVRGTLLRTNFWDTMYKDAPT